jgi:trimeric autotransporter adhesin
LQSSTTGAQNTAIGLDAGDYVTTGNYNTLLGYNSGSSTTNLTTGDANTLIGAFCHTGAAGSGFANGFGYDIDAAAGYTTLGNAASDIRAAHGVATWATVSDERYKKDIVDSTVGLSFINALLPRTFKYKTLGELPETFRAYKEGSTQVFKNSDTNHGFIAQEIKAAIDLHPEIKDGFKLWDEREDGGQEVAEAALIPVLVKAIQELSAKNDALEARLAALES